MAQVARANAAAAGGDPRSLRRLTVQFRGMGVPESEIKVTGTVREEGDGTVIVDTEADAGHEQDHPQRGSRAEALLVSGAWR